MPYRYYSTRRKAPIRSTRKRYIRKRVKRNVGTASITRPVYFRKTPRFRFKKWPSWPKATPSSDTRLIKLVYADDDFTLAPDVGNTYQDYHCFSGNSPYDPDVSGVGVQPYGYDNWCSNTGFYYRYKVMASSITMYMSCNELTAQSPIVRYFLWPQQDGSYPSSHDPSDLSQIPRVVQRMSGVNNTSGSCIKIKAYATTNSVLGKAQGSDDDATAAYNSSPTNEWFWWIAADNSSWDTDVAIKMNVKIKYYTILMQPNSMNES